MIDKTCKKCGKEKPLTSFSIKRHYRLQNGEERTKRGSICRQCIKIAASVAGRCVECNTLVVPGQRRCEIHRQRMAAYAMQRYKKARQLVLTHYGQNCYYCGESLEFFLTIDHILDDGKKHREVVRGSYLYFWLIKQDFPSGFQTLCYNCNGAKAKMGELVLLQTLLQCGRLNGNIKYHDPKTGELASLMGCLDGDAKNCGQSVNANYTACSNSKTTTS